MSECYVPGCPDEPVVRLKYRDSLGELCIEARCAVCAKTLRESDRTSVVDALILTDDGTTPQYDTLTEQERELIRRITSGPFGRFAA